MTEMSKAKKDSIKKRLLKKFGKDFEIKEWRN